MRHGLAGDRGLRHQRATGVADGFDTELNQKRVDLRFEREVFALGGLLDHIDGHERHFFMLASPGREPVALAAIVNLSEAFAVPESDCYPIAKRIQKIVFSFVVLVADPKAFDLVEPASQYRARQRRGSRNIRLFVELPTSP
jgi:hypothetical protein